MQDGTYGWLIQRSLPAPPVPGSPPVVEKLEGAKYPNQPAPSGSRREVKVGAG